MRLGNRLHQAEGRQLLLTTDLTAEAPMSHIGRVRRGWGYGKERVVGVLG
jgi:hypothetical protein